jgi:lipopolysaccharide/colanic/teichoic acid biosynthesis glycosyltransferase
MPAWIRSCLADASDWGWLADGRLGVLIDGNSEDNALELERRGELLRRRLAECGVASVEIYSYPLARTPDSRRDPLIENGDSSGTVVVEGGVERYFVRPSPWWKRAMDILLSASLLVLLSPLMVLVALAIKLTSSGPILFRQWRTGRGGEPFVMYKFRSMSDGADMQQDALRHLNEQDGPAFKIRNDPRVTRVGWWLRRTCLDEVPQLWNVLRGEMSLVGPRPLPRRESAACSGWYRQRLEVMPGITCLWQVHGRSLVSFDDWMRQDVQYVQQQSLGLDLRILLETVPFLVPARIRDSGRPAMSDSSPIGAELP